MNILKRLRRPGADVHDGKMWRLSGTLGKFETMQQQLVVADDEAGFRTFVRKVGTALNWDVIECANGVELVETLSDLRRDSVILVDIMMPRMDGIQAINHLAEMSRGQPVYFVTGGLAVYGDVVSLMSASEDLRFEGVLQKPLSLRDLSGVLEKHAGDRVDPGRSSAR